MTAFQPMSPHKAVEFVEAAGVPDARRLIADFAAAGLIKSYALSVETIEVDGRRSCVRDGALSHELWQRVIHGGVVDDVWTGGTVRLPGADLIGGQPEVRITGIRFGEKYLQRVVDQHLGKSVKAKPLKKAPPVAVRVVEDAAEDVSVEAAPRRRQPDPVAIPPGAEWVKVSQVQQATGFGRTKINELMMDGRLVRRKIDGRVLIEVASIRALLGVTV